jgi:hypothetical protein
MSDEARALEALARRRRSSPLGVPIVAADEPSDGTPLESSDEITSPVDLLAREPTDDETEMCRELVAKTSYISPQSPATISDFIKVVKRLNDVKTEERRARRDSANRDLELAGAKGPPLERLSAIEHKMRIVWALLVAIGTAAAGSIVTVAKGLYERGEGEGAQKIRLEHFERDNERLRVELKELRERVDRNGRRLDYPLPKVNPP